MTTTGPVLLFDGVCNFCNSTVHFILAHEARPEIRFASLQSDVARETVRARGLPGDISTIVFIDGDRAWIRSAAVVQVLRRLRLPWSLLAILWVVPRPLRDAGYAIFARLRYRLFGRRDTCMIPTPELRARFLA